MDEDTVLLSFVNAATNNERYSYLQWHIERLTGRAVAYRRPYRRQDRSPNPRAVLRSMLSGRSRIRAFGIDPTDTAVSAHVGNLIPSETAQLCRDFEEDTGMKLRLKGQFSFGF